ncbi:MAG: hypothetical protein ONB48_09895 [candidate division KSB1 bacterium]|nr:hypothetical protein [candidate division KSB1 bacterium]MDZ7273799.1 hypothetical protein [candidate division KSB1 bacterium]MDZ7285955.1 hypothetical protein [candidate division KSB1 bacterium]MDZ7298987.1 hypothetical protein [candidate division KSB1 bacterium]MDZ7309211.1 hypothetical protein [candidate division KSB1 bacterium]
MSQTASSIPRAKEVKPFAQRQEAQTAQNCYSQTQETFAEKPAQEENPLTAAGVLPGGTATFVQAVPGGTPVCLAVQSL